jgi:Arc/MetJ-type ribon-helix-helix transcriptional regulator
MKKKVSVAIDEDLLIWVEDQIQKKRFASVSHAVNYSLNEVKKQGEKLS